MKRWILLGAAAVVGLVIVAVVLLVSNLGPVIKTAVNTHGPGITKTALKVDGVGISVFTGRASLNGFLLGSPAGFKAPHAIRVGSIAVDVDRSTLPKPTPHAPGSNRRILTSPSGSRYL